MFTINAYAVHPLVSSYLKLWRFVLVVTDWVTFFFSCLCCQCLNNMPFEAPPGSVSSKASIDASQIDSRVPEVDLDRACGEPFMPQNLVIDFNRQPGDNEGIAQKCSDFWDFVHSQSALDGMLVKPDPPDVHCETATVKDKPTSQNKLKDDTREDDYPAIHILKIINKIEGTQFRFDYTYYQEAEGWLKLHEIPATWKDAYLNCYYEGAVLASPENELTKAALERVINDKQSGQSLPPCGVYTGIHATFGKGAYFSIEGTPLSRMPIRWAPGEPDNADNSEDCLLMLPNGTLADVNCSDVFPYICYRKKPKNMAMLNVCGTVDNGYSFEKTTGSCYKFHTDPLNWTRAFVACAHEGGHLAIINSKVEAQLIQELYSKTYSSMVAGKYNRDIAFLGFRNFEGNFLWMTIHGQTLKEAGYDEWQKGQPDQFGGGQDCGAIFRGGVLDDNHCTNVLPFICEKTPSSLLADDDL